jgi:tight adherence protein C
MSDPSFERLAAVNDTYFAVHIGEMQFTSNDIFIVAIALTAAALSAFNLGRIAQSESRQSRLLEALRRGPTLFVEPSPTPRLPWYQWLGAAVATTRVIGTAAQERLLGALVSAGVKGHGHLAALLTAKLCSAILALPLCWLLLEWRHFFVGATSIRLAVLTGAAFLGWRGPEVLLSRMAARRRVRLETGIPDALDLLVICAEAGLSLDHAIEQVGHVLRSSNPEVAEEFVATAAEMRISAVRDQAFDNLARRAGIASLRGIVAALNQSIRFGTPLAGSLRAVAAEMRTERLVRFEERAARLPVLLTMPLMTFILPSLMIVIGTPLALRISDMLARGP